MRSGADAEAAAAAVLRRQVRLLLPSADDVKAAWRIWRRIARAVFRAIAGDHMLSTAIASGSHVFLACFYDICGGFHAC